MSTSAAQAAAFYAEAMIEAAVWTLRDADGVPAPKNGEGQRAMPFWSKESRALKVRDGVPAYGGFETQRVPLVELRERWLPGLTEDGIRVGLNWSGARATGYDVLASDVEAGFAARE